MTSRVSPRAETADAIKATAVVVATIVLGLLSTGPAAQGQGRAQAPKVARIEQIRDNLYWITEGTGGPGASNLAVLVADNGVVLVDTKNPDGEPRSSA